MTADSEPTVERHSFRYPWRERFPDARQVAGFEVGAVSEAEGAGAYWLIKDEATMADFLDPDDDAGLLAHQAPHAVPTRTRIVAEFKEHAGAARQSRETVGGVPLGNC